MALILDKTKTGVTSMDESGNTITTGFTGLLSYTDRFGNTYQNPYLVVDMVFIDKLNGQYTITVLIYKDKNARINKNVPIFNFTHLPLEDNPYDEYFSLEAMTSSNVYKKAYEIISTIYTGWKSDE